MTLKTADDIRRRALAMGAEASIDGRAFNTSGLRAVPRPLLPTPAPLPQEPEPEAAAPEGLTAGDVEAIVAQRMAPVIQSLQMAIEACVALSASQAQGRVIAKHQLHVTYDRDDRITDIEITPIYVEDSR